MTGTSWTSHLPELLDNVAQALIVQDRAGRVVYRNLAAQALMQRLRAAPDATLPFGSVRRQDGLDMPQSEQPAQRTLAQGTPCQGVVMGLENADASLTWVEVDTAPIASDARNGPAWVLSTLSDIGRCRTLEGRLQESEARFRHLAENIDLVFWVGSPDWRTVEYVSPAYARIWQRPAEQLYADGMDWFQAVVEEDRDAILATLPAADTPTWRAIEFPPYRIRRPDGSVRWIAARAFAVPGPDGATLRVTGIAEDISERHEHQRHLEEMAHYDALTHLPNRLLLSDRMQLAMARARRMSQILAVCLLDLDGFKPINDQYGHKAGDELLIQLAARLTQAMRADDTVARLGGDEFVLLLGGLRGNSELEEALGRILRLIAAPFQIDGRGARVTASIGVTLYPVDANDADTLLRHADHAMYLAKQAGKHRYHLFNPALEIRERENRDAIGRIETALRDGQFILHYQPIIDCRQGSVMGMEALLRWQHPLLGLLAPDEFLPLIEGHDDLALKVGSWALHTAIAQAEAWILEGLDLMVDINVFPQQFRDLDFQSLLSDAVARHPALPPERITLEIVESSALEDIVATNRIMHRGAELGIHYALDDFGTGYSSMTYLRRLPVKLLKIDKSFIQDMLIDPEDMAIVEAIIGLASAFRHEVVAEGVESLEQILMLGEMGCHRIQGYALSRPMPISDVGAWLRAFTPDPRWRGQDSLHLSRDDFPLILAEVHHRQWLKRVVEWAHAGQDDERPPAQDHHECAFGRWYHGDGQRRYGHLPAYTDADPPHVEVHRVGAELVALRRAGRTEAIAECETRLQRASETFVDTLRGLRRAVSHPAAGQ